jgi:hypothetical protein
MDKPAVLTHIDVKTRFIRSGFVFIVTKIGFFQLHIENDLGVEIQQKISTGSQSTDDQTTFG